MNINSIWHSKNIIDWDKALEHYWDYVKPDNMAIEKEFGSLNAALVEKMNSNEWHQFLERYFKWKYTAANRYASTTKHFNKYKIENKLDELDNIKKVLFSFNKENIEEGLKIAKQIKGLGVAGASGLLSVLFPEHYGTVDQFVVEAMQKISNLPEEKRICKINKDSISLSDAVIMIEIMRRKARENNELFNSNEWTPRKIDMILWSTRM